jgi:hypothetical protein
MIRAREDLAMAKRIVIKAGTSVVSTPEGFPSLSRMADIVEHVSPLYPNSSVENRLQQTSALQMIALYFLGRSCRPT